MRASDPRGAPGAPDVHDRPAAAAAAAAVERRARRDPPGAHVILVRRPDDRDDRAARDVTCSCCHFLRTSDAGGITAGGFGDSATGSSSVVPQK